MPTFHPNGMSGLATPGYMSYGDPRMTANRSYYRDTPLRTDNQGAYQHYHSQASFAPTLTRPCYDLPAPYPTNNGSQGILPGNAGGFHNPNAPMLPPIRPRNDSVVTDDVRAQAKHEEQTKKQEEAPVGGISAKLDYELERMTDFVAGAAQGIIQPGAQVQPAFRKWVLQVLTATRLPSATILLSLHYLTIRLREFPASVGTSEHLLYRFLAVSMILGSKFLDDNTFINKSWSDVTGINVAELNTLEIDWLALIGFDLHADITDPNGIKLWIRAWKDFDGQMKHKARLQAAEISLRTKQLPPVIHQQHHTSFSSGYITPVSNASSPLSANHRYMSADPWNTGNGQSGFNNYEHDSYASKHHRSNTSTYPVIEKARQTATSQLRPILPAPQAFVPMSYTSWDLHNWQNVQTYDQYGTATYEYATGRGYAPQPVIG